MGPAHRPSPHAPIVVGFDGTPEACDALALARVTALAGSGELIVASVYPGREGGMAEPRRDFFRRVFERARHELGDAPFARCEMIDSPAHGLYTLADAEGAALLVVGSTHRGRFGRVFPGSLGEQLLSGTPCPVAIAPRGFVERPRLDTIGVAYDDGPQSRCALDYGAELARRLGSSLRVVSVGPRYGGFDELFGDLAEADARLDEILACGLERVPPGVAAEGRARCGDPAPELIDDSREVDLLVVGSRGFGPVRSALLGSVSGELVRQGQCAVLVVPRDHDVAQGFVPEDEASGVTT